jgi:excisionase family DNA binding protein
MQTTNAGIEPAFLSIAEAATYTAESQWTVKDKLRRGIYRAKKSGRRTLVDMASVKAHLADLPDAKFAKPSPRKAA